MKLYQELATLVDARLTCSVKQRDMPWLRDWIYKHRDKANELVDRFMPSGSGFDAGTKLDWDRSTGDKLVIHTSFHHMDECGSYDGWTEHDIFVRPSLIHGVTLHITGRNRKDIKDHIHECFQEAIKPGIRGGQNRGLIHSQAVREKDQQAEPLTSISFWHMLNDEGDRYHGPTSLLGKNAFAYQSERVRRSLLSSGGSFEVAGKWRVCPGRVLAARNRERCLRSGHYALLTHHFGGIVSCWSTQLKQLLPRRSTAWVMKRIPAM